MTVYEPTENEVALAQDWHGGQQSMLYAIASTGSLTLGTRRPVRTFWDDGRIVHEPMSDDEWQAELRSRLLAELRDCEPHANTADGITFRRWVRKLEHGEEK